jgi:hypothetical protein
MVYRIKRLLAKGFGLVPSAAVSQGKDHIKTFLANLTQQLIVYYMYTYNISYIDMNRGAC